MRRPSLIFSRLAALALTSILVFPAFSFDFPLTDSSIRDAYFLGRRQGGIPSDILKRYSRSIDELHQGNCVSQARIETPFLQMVEYAASMPNYSAQDAVQELSKRSVSVHLFIDICYVQEAPPPYSVKLKFIQNKKEVIPVVDDRSPFAERFSDTSFLLPNGESAELQFDPRKLDSSELKILIDTPNGQHAETTFHLQSLR